MNLAWRKHHLQYPKNCPRSNKEGGTSWTSPRGTGAQLIVDTLFSSFTVRSIVGTCDKIVALDCLFVIPISSRQDIIGTSDVYIFYDVKSELINMLREKFKVEALKQHNELLWWLLLLYHLLQPSLMPN